MRKTFLLRHLGALLYDGLIILALWLLGTFFLALLIHPTQHALDASTPERILYWIFLLALAWAFLVGFWSHGGQTLGMKAWRLKLVCREKQTADWVHASIRFLVALCEWLIVGFLLLPVYLEKPRSPGHRASTLSLYLSLWLVTGFLLLALSSCLPRGSLHDRLSRTRLIKTDAASSD